MTIRAKTELGLGTVQLGLPYGPNAERGLMPPSEAHSILNLAVQSGIRFFDTAIQYGESERRLGGFDFSKGEGIEISSKIPSVSKEIYSNPSKYKEYVFLEVKQSLQRLKLPAFSLLQFHQCDEDFLESPAFAGVVKELIEQGVARSVGVSVYTPDEALCALDVKGVSALQVPVNLLDRRFISEPVFSQIRHARLIGRSIFLQGLLLEKSPLPQGKLRGDLERVKAEAIVLSRNANCSLEGAALSFIFQEVEGLSQAIIGVDSSEMLKHNLEVFKKLPKESLNIGNVFAELAEEATQKGLVDPRNWQKL